jgi:hypothetical protein
VQGAQLSFLKKACMGNHKVEFITKISVKPFYFIRNLYVPLVTLKAILVYTLFYEKVVYKKVVLDWSSIHGKLRKS